MRTISTALRNAIDSGNIAKLVKITRKDTVVHGFTDHDKPLTIDGTLYEPAAGLQSVVYTTNANVEVSNQEVAASAIDLPDEDIKAGLYDDAEIEAAWGSWEDPSAGRLITFVGNVGSIIWTNEGFKADVVNFMKRMELNIGTQFTAGCRHELYGTAEVGKIGFCGVSATSFTFSGTVATQVIPKWKFTAALGQPDGYFSNGVITFTSGINNGLSYVIKKQVGDTFELFLPALGQFPAGTTFTIKAGCDKSLETCKTKFNNVVNFGGFPHINNGVTMR